MPVRGSTVTVVCLLLATMVSPVFSRWFYDAPLNCFTRCMTCLMTGLDCQPHLQFPSGYEDCEFSCMVPEDSILKNHAAIQSSLHFCRVNNAIDLRLLRLCVRKYIKEVFAEVDKDLDWKPMNGETTTNVDDETEMTTKDSNETTTDVNETTKDANETTTDVNETTTDANGTTRDEIETATKDVNEREMVTDYPSGDDLP